jgi:hypothetical protein
MLAAGLVTTLKERKPNIPVIAITGFERAGNRGPGKKGGSGSGQPIRMSVLRKRSEL